MKKSESRKPKLLSGSQNLAVDGILAVTDMVEELHAHFSPFTNGFLKNSKKKKKGIAGFVYWAIRKITQLVGFGLDQTLPKLEHLIGNQKNARTHDAVLAAVNGVLGDYLVEKNNGLAIEMQFRKNGESITNEELHNALVKTDGKLLILVHGLCMNDRQWSTAKLDIGKQLEEDFNYYSIQLFYNTGLHISENGTNFSELLESTFVDFPELKSVVIIGHSMGGLITRSAFNDAQRSEKSWPSKISKVMFLGSPHLGSPLERAGNWFETILEGNPFTAPFSKLGKIRSAGVTDLRYASLVKEDWQGKDRFEKGVNQNIPLPLPENVEFYTIAASIPKTEKHVKDEVLGDGLVPISSALGNASDPKYKLHFKDENQAIIRGINHMQLLSSQEVYDKIKTWMEPQKKLSLMNHKGTKTLGKS